MSKLSGTRRVHAGAVYLLTSLLASGAVHAQSAEPEVRVIVLGLKATGLEEGEAALLDELISVEVGKAKGVAAISGADVKQMVELEAEKQASGCDDSSCLSEITDALGARYAVYGRVGKLGSQTVLTLNLFDAEGGVAVNRIDRRENSMDAVARSLNAAVRELVAPIASTAPIPIALPTELGPVFLWGGVGVASAGTIAFRGLSLARHHRSDQPGRCPERRRLRLPLLGDRCARRRRCGHGRRGLRSSRMNARLLVLSLLAFSGCGFFNGLASGQTCGVGGGCSEADNCLPCGRLCGRDSKCKDPEAAYDECRFGELMAGDDDFFLDPVSAEVSGDGFDLTLSLSLLDFDDDLVLQEDGLRFVGFERLGDDDTAVPEEFELGPDESFEPEDVTQDDSGEISTITVVFAFNQAGPPEDGEIAIAIMDNVNGRRSNGVCVVEDGNRLD